jgi:hypothetical protein
MQTRLLDGYGYVQSFFLAITVRHIATFLNVARQNGMHLLKLVWLILSWSRLAVTSFVALN